VRRLVPGLHRPPSQRQPGPGGRAAGRAPGYEIVEIHVISDSAWSAKGDDYKSTLDSVLGDAHAGRFQVLIVWAAGRAPPVLEARRAGFTFAGAGIAVVVTCLASLLAERAPGAARPQAAAPAGAAG